MSMSPTPPRRIRSEVALSAHPIGSGRALPPGEWFVEQDTAIVRVFEDAAGATHVADLDLVDFLDALAHRHVVFVSWG